MINTGWYYSRKAEDRDTTAAKKHLTQLIAQQPDDSSYEEPIRELAFALMVERGLRASDERRTISSEELCSRIGTWAK